MGNDKPAVPDPHDLRALTRQVMEFVQREAERTAKDGAENKPPKRPPVSWWKETADGNQPAGFHTISIWEAVQNGCDRAPVFCFSTDEDSVGYGYAMDQSFMHVRHFVRKAWEDGLTRSMLDGSVLAVANYFCRRGFWVIFSIRQPNLPKLYACWSVEKPHPRPGECLIGQSLLQGVATGVITRPPPKPVDVSPPPPLHQERRGVSMPEPSAPSVRVSRAEARVAQAVWSQLDATSYQRLNRTDVAATLAITPAGLTALLTALVQRGVLQKTGERNTTKYRRGIGLLTIFVTDKAAKPIDQIDLDHVEAPPDSEAPAAPVPRPAPEPCAEPVTDSTYNVDPREVLVRQLQLVALLEELASLEAHENTVIKEAEKRRDELRRRQELAREEYHRNHSLLSAALPTT